VLLLMRVDVSSQERQVVAELAASVLAVQLIPEA
jgi:hypothetical protein